MGGGEGGVMANKDNPYIGRKFEETAKNFFEVKGIILRKQFLVSIGIGEKKKGHAFDLGSINPPILVECKAHTWTKGRNTPSAKLSVWNEAMYLFSIAPPKFRKIFFVLKSDRDGETLADYYISRFKHLIPADVEIWEYDPETENAYQKRCKKGLQTVIRFELFEGERKCILKKIC